MVAKVMDVDSITREGRRVAQFLSWARVPKQVKKRSALARRVASLQPAGSCLCLKGRD